MTANQIPVVTAKQERLYRTYILDRYIGGNMIELQNILEDDKLLSLYKVQKGANTAIFKSISCGIDDTRNIEMAKKEYELGLECSKLSERVIKPLSFIDQVNESVRKYYHESLYEYGGEHIDIALSKKNTKSILGIMDNVMITMCSIQKKNIYHLNLVPNRLVVKDASFVKIVGYGSSVRFERKLELIKSGKIAGQSLLYYPPEVMSGEKGDLSKIDVYSWGMILYKLITGRSEDDLKTDSKLIATDFNKFLENLKSINVKDDSDGKLKEKIINILTSALDPDPNKRLNFMQFEEKMLDKNYYKTEIKRLTEAVAGLTKQNSSLTETIDKKDEEIKRLKGEISEILRSGNEVELWMENLKAKSKITYDNVKSTYENIMGGQDYINLYHEPIGSVGAKIIAQAIRHSTKISHLVLGFCKIGIDGARALGNVLKACTSLKALSLGKFTGAEIFPEDCNYFKVDGTKAIAEGLKFSSLEILDLGYCDVSEIAMDDLVKAANSTKNLKWVCLVGNPELKGKTYPFRSSIEVKYES